MHDKFQEAAFSLIPSDNIPNFQLQIGRNLRKHLLEQDFQNNLQLIASLMIQGRKEGRKEIKGEDEKERENTRRNSCPGFVLPLLERLPKSRLFHPQSSILKPV